MNDKKLTDSEIIEDLKLWIDLSKRTDTPPFITYLFLQQILDLINRLQAENKRFKSIKNSYDFAEYRKQEIKAEAYKECIEKVEEIICNNTYPDFDINHKAVNIWKAEAYKDINNLLKELVGEDK